MPFVESSNTLRAQTHTSELSLPVLAGIGALVVVALVLFAGNTVFANPAGSFALTQAQHSSSLSDEDGQGAADENDAQATRSSSGGKVVVFVSGAVESPGVYELPDTARLTDAIAAAGGFADGAARDYNNLARLLVDGEQVHVPTEEDSQAGVPSPAAAASAGGPQTGQALVNINTATASELESLPGIGPATAAKIIASRETDGPFLAPEEITRVAGIGEKKYASLEGLICV